GNKPDDTKPPGPPNPLRGAGEGGGYDPNAPPGKNFRTPVHCVTVSKDDLVYVCDRQGDRLQVFTLEGKFVKEGIVAKETMNAGSVWDIALSADPQQQFVYIPDAESSTVRILRRDTLEVVSAFGDGGQQPGQFYGAHSIATDSKGNVYVGET